MNNILERRETVPLRLHLRRLGWAALIAFTVKGVISTTLIVIAALTISGEI